MDHFTQGVFAYVSGPPSINDLGSIKSHAAPFTRDRTRASKVISGLVEKGVVERRKVKGHPRGLIEYSLNVNWDTPEGDELPDKFVLKNKSLFFEELEAVQRLEDKEERRKERRREQKRKYRLKKKESD